MIIKLVGAGFVILGCSCVAFIVSNSLKRECDILQQLISALEYILCELNYRMTPLPELFRLTSSVCRGSLCRLFLIIAEELDKQHCYNATECIENALRKAPNIPTTTVHCITLLGQTIGSFDLAGQIRTIESVKAEAERLLNSARADYIGKIRCYRTLGLSAGAALVIIFI